ncbi:uncharacterized protein LOC129579720 [Sitodiplosis mosellana]|uniref:uncharacterized protein LOC129579720 n=1 Tax=Sitodiplosis mosellana TaxID=263140 RepID=UPI002444B8AA|nr:uncharacterized protein LOC129579720 [Sitodiplosis mosellana]
MELRIDVKDQNDTVHDTQKVKVENPDSKDNPMKDVNVGHLQKELTKVFFLESCFQEIHFVHDGKDVRFDLELEATLLSALHIENGSNLVLKHSRLNIWKALEDALSRISRRYKRGWNVAEEVQQNVDIYKKLIGTKFFRVYPNFEEIIYAFEEKCGHCLDPTGGAIDQAATQYFLSLFESNPANPTVKIKCDRKTAPGLQGGRMCTVTIGTTATKFHVKMHSGISSRSSHTSDDTSLCELFAYKVLQIIGVGPLVHFIPKVHNSTFELYIATADIPGFRTAAKRRYFEEIGKLDYLKEILQLIDVHQSNYGSDENGKLWIVDFKIGNPFQSKYKNSSNVNSDLSNKFKEYDEQWKFLEAIDKADKEIADQKSFLERHNINRQKSNDYKEYLDEIKMIVTYLKDPEQIAKKRKLSQATTSLSS